MINLQIVLEDLADTQREIAELIGLENYIRLSKRFGGDNGLYIQKYSEISKNARNREIRKKYNGYNIPMLANLYNLSERQIRTIISDDSDSEQLTLYNS